MIGVFDYFNRFRAKIRQKNVMCNSDIVAIGNQLWVISWQKVSCSPDFDPNRWFSMPNGLGVLCVGRHHVACEWLFERL